MGVKRVPIKVISLFTALVASAIFTSPSASAANGPPEARLHTRVAFQSGRLLSYCWTTTDSESCLDSAPSFPRTKVKGAQRNEITFYKELPPLTVDIQAWSKRDAYGAPLGNPEEIDAAPPVPCVSEQTALCWTIGFTVPKKSDYFLVISAKWQDEDGVPRPQEASWSFSLTATV
jgi:hypothetical protein